MIALTAFIFTYLTLSLITVTSAIVFDYELDAETPGIQDRILLFLMAPVLLFFGVCWGESPIEIVRQLFQLVAFGKVSHTDDF